MTTPDTSTPPVTDPADPDGAVGRILALADEYAKEVRRESQPFIAGGAVRATRAALAAAVRRLVGIEMAAIAWVDSRGDPLDVGMDRHYANCDALEAAVIALAAPRTEDHDDAR